MMASSTFRRARALALLPAPLVLSLFLLLLAAAPVAHATGRRLRDVYGGCFGGLPGCGRGGGVASASAVANANAVALGGGIAVANAAAQANAINTRGFPYGFFLSALNDDDAQTLASDLGTKLGLDANATACMAQAAKTTGGLSLVGGSSTRAGGSEGGAAAYGATNGASMAMTGAVDDDADRAVDGSSVGSAAKGVRAADGGGAAADGAHSTGGVSSTGTAGGDASGTDGRVAGGSTTRAVDGSGNVAAAGTTTNVTAAGTTTNVTGATGARASGGGVGAGAGGAATPVGPSVSGQGLVGMAGCGVPPAAASAALSCEKWASPTAGPLCALAASFNTSCLGLQLVNAGLDSVNAGQVVNVPPCRF